MEEKAKKIAELLKLLANEQRLLILCALMHGRKNKNARRIMYAHLLRYVPREPSHRKRRSLFPLWMLKNASFAGSACSSAQWARLKKWNRELNGPDPGPFSIPHPISSHTGFRSP